MERSSSTLDIMLDLETLGNGNTPVLAQVAAVSFDMTTGEIFGEFNMLVNPQSCVNVGLKCDGSTVDWWLKQDNEVIQKVIVQSLASGSNVSEVLSLFSRWIQDQKKAFSKRSVEVWGNGALADNKWIISAYDACKLELPWKYSDDRDVRTLVALGKRLLNVDPKKDLPFVGLKHDALADCKHQIRYCHEIFKKVSSLTPSNGSDKK